MKNLKTVDTEKISLKAGLVRRKTLTLKLGLVADASDSATNALIYQILDAQSHITENRYQQILDILELRKTPGYWKTLATKMKRNSCWPSIFRMSKRWRSCRHSI
jgi:hypothetical protein